MRFSLAKILMICAFSIIFKEVSASNGILSAYASLCGRFIKESREEPFLRALAYAQSLSGNLEKPQQLKLRHVGPREVLQGVKIPVETRIYTKWTQDLLDAGFNNVEAISWKTKNMSQIHYKTVFNVLSDHVEKLTYLTMGKKQFDDFVKSGGKDAAVVIGLTDEFNSNNIGRSTEEILEIADYMIQIAQEKKINIRTYFSMVFERDNQDFRRFATFAARYKNASSIHISDTIGVATEDKIISMMHALHESQVDFSKVFLHLHRNQNKPGLELSCLVTYLYHGGCGIDVGYASEGGGCHRAGQQTGANISDLEVVYLLKVMGVKTGIDLEKLFQANSEQENQFNAILDQQNRLQSKI